MSNQEIIARLRGACDALDNISIAKGVINANNLTGSYLILEELIQVLRMQEESESALENE